MKWPQLRDFFKIKPSCLLSYFYISYWKLGFQFPKEIQDKKLKNVIRNLQKSEIRDLSLCEM